MGAAPASTTLSRTTAAVKRRFVGLMAGRGAPAGLDGRELRVLGPAESRHNTLLLVQHTVAAMLVTSDGQLEVLIVHSFFLCAVGFNSRTSYAVVEFGRQRAISRGIHCHTTSPSRHCPSPPPAYIRKVVQRCGRETENSPLACTNKLPDITWARHSPSLIRAVLRCGRSKECPGLSRPFLGLSVVCPQHVLASLQQEV